MKINISLELEKSELPIDWRRTFLSFIKSILEKEAPEVFQEFYGVGSTAMKPFTFWTLLHGATFHAEHIGLEQKEISLFISTTDTKLAFYFYNGMKQFKSTYEMKKNSFRVKSVKLENEKLIDETEILVTMLSPLVVRQHFREEKDRYILHNEDGFSEVLHQSIATKLQNVELVPEVVPIKCKKVIVKAYGTRIPATLGVFKLVGDIATLNRLYQEGLGSKTSAGFGKFEVIG